MRDAVGNSPGHLDRVAPDPPAPNGERFHAGAWSTKHWSSKRDGQGTPPPSPNSELAKSGDTGPLLKIRLLEEDGRGICGAAVYGRERVLQYTMYL